jgi:hypothetical protein
MTIDEAIERMGTEIRYFLDDMEYCGHAEDMEAFDLVMESVRGKADPRQTSLPGMVPVDAAGVESTRSPAPVASILEGTK